MKKIPAVILIFITILIATSLLANSTSAAITSCSNISSSDMLSTDINATGDCMFIASNNIVLDCANFTITGDATGIAITAIGYTNITIKNCNIKNFLNGIIALSVANTSVLNNNISTDDTGISICCFDKGEVINTVSAGNAGNGIRVNSETSIVINSKGISSSGAGINFLPGIAIPGFFPTSMLLNSIGISNSSLGIVAQSTGATINNNIGISNTDRGFQVDSAPSNNLNNNTAISNTGIALIIDGSQNNKINNTKIVSNNTWLYITGQNNQFTNTHFESPYGSIHYKQTLTPLIFFFGNETEATASIVNLTQRDINMNFNKIFVNASTTNFTVQDFVPINVYNNLTFLNTTAEITLKNISFSDPKPVVDFDDDNTFVDCNQPLCNELSFSNGLYTYNVTHFTSYSSVEGLITSCLDTINSSTVLNTNLSLSDGTCITINANNVEFDCNGFSITGNFSGIGIYNLGFNNVTIKNCIITNFFDGIRLENANNNLITNNTANSNLGIGIVLNNSNNNIVINNIARFNSDSGIQIITYSKDNIITSNDFTNNSIRSIYLFPDISNKIYECHNTIDASNKAGNRNKPVLYYNDTSNIIIKDQLDVYGQVILCNVTNSLIENISVIDGSAIELFNSINITLRNVLNKINSGVGFLVWYSHNNTMVDSKFLFAADDNIQLCGSNNNLIENNTFLGSLARGHEGIHIYDDSSFNVIKNNNIQLQRVSGISINDHFPLCTNPPGSSSNNLIEGNVIANNGINTSIGSVGVAVGFGDGVTLVGVDFTTIINNLIINNFHSGIDMVGGGLVSSDNNLIANNTINNNNLAGIFQLGGVVMVGGIGITNSNFETINSNTVCYNTNLDFNVNNAFANSGTSNTCNNPDGWNDMGVMGCTLPCPPPPTCVTPMDDLYITSTTLLCTGTYSILDLYSTGVIIINTNNIVLDCNNAALIGSGGGFAIYNPGFNNVTIQNCVLQNYTEGIRVENSVFINITNNIANLNNGNGIYLFRANSSSLINNTANSNKLNGIKLTNSTNITILNNTVLNNAQNGINIDPSFAFLFGNIIFGHTDPFFDVFVDAIDGSIATGDNNFCTTTSNYTDASAPSGCASTSPPPPPPPEPPNIKGSGSPIFKKRKVIEFFLD